MKIRDFIRSVLKLTGSVGHLSKVTNKLTYLFIVIAKFIFNTLKLSLFLSIIILVIFSYLDYEELKLAFEKATNDDMKMFIQTMVFMGIFFNTFCYVVYKIKPSNKFNDPDKNTFLEYKHKQTLEIIEETISLGVSPPITAYKNIIALIKELESKNTGNDLLDMKVIKALNLSHKSTGFKPTQNLKDAKELLKTRYNGLTSKLNWHVEIEKHETKRLAVISIDNFFCYSVLANNTSLAVTIAALLKETFLFSNDL